MSYRFAVKLDDLWSGEKITLEIGGHDVLLVRLDSEVFAYIDRCAHRGLSLGLGHLEGAVLTCAAHEWKYDVRTGSGINPKGARLRAVQVRVEGGDVLVELDGLERDGGPCRS